MSPTVTLSQGKARRSSTLFPSMFKSIVTTVLILVLLATLGLQFSVSRVSSEKDESMASSSSLLLRQPTTTTTTVRKKKKTLRVAFGGNSILHFHDCPGLLVAMLRATGHEVIYDACLLDGASLTLLLMRRCSTDYSPHPDDNNPTIRMSHLLRENQWDYIFLNDQTQAPVRKETHSQSMSVIHRTYSRLSYRAGATPIFLQTAAYQKDIPDDIGTFDQFTEKLSTGYQAYADAMTSYFRDQNHNNNNNNENAPRKGLVAPLGLAYADLYHSNRPLWELLYVEDGYHPSPLGTWLQACVLYATMLDQEPPPYDSKFWISDNGGQRQYPPHRIPTAEEAETLRQAALRVTLQKSSFGGKVVQSWSSEKDESLASSSSLLLRQPTTTATTTTTTTTAKKKTLRVAFGGNSILNFHDCPGLLVAMLRAEGHEIIYETCLQDGGSFPSLRSGTCTSAFSPNPNRLFYVLRAKWDYIFLNDQTQSPVRKDTHSKAMAVVKLAYAPKLYQAGATPIFLQTAAYRQGIPDDIGTFDQFTDKLTHGYQAYANAVTSYFRDQNNNKNKNNENAPQKGLVAPVGLAYADLYHSNRPLWELLYVDDGYHPSPLGTWLQACVLYATMLDQEPPPYDSKFWINDNGGPRQYPPHRIPTAEEAETLRQAALRVTLQKSSFGGKVVVEGD